MTTENIKKEVIILATPGGVHRVLVGPLVQYWQESHWWKLFVDTYRKLHQDFDRLGKHEVNNMYADYLKAQGFEEAVYSVR